MDAVTKEHYRVPLIKWSPYVFDNEEDETTGFMIKFLDVLKRFDNTNVTLLPSKEKPWGLKDGESWTEVFGTLQRNEADFSLIPAPMYNEMFNDFATSHPFRILRWRILFGTHSTNENDIFSVVGKWIAILFVAMALLVCFTVKLNSVYSKAKSKLPLMFLLQCLLGTNPQSVKCSGVARFLAVLWSLSSFILWVFLSSEMTSQFTSKTELLPFDTMEDVFHFPNAKPLLFKGTAYVKLIRKSAQSNLAYAEVIKRADADPDSCIRIWNRVWNDSNIHSEIENRNMFVYLSDVLNWEFIKATYAKSGNCKMKLGKTIRISFATMVFKKNISRALVNTVNKRLRQVIEGDCFEDRNPFLKNELHPCQRTETPDAFVVINVHAFTVIFRVCLLGFLASLITLILEICVNKRS